MYRDINDACAFYLGPSHHRHRVSVWLAPHRTLGPTRVEYVYCSIFQTVLVLRLVGVSTQFQTEGCVL